MGTPAGIANMELLGAGAGQGFTASHQVYMHLAPALPTGGGGGNTIIDVVPTTTFIFRAWCPSGAKYEVWTGTSRNTPNPNGHTYTETTVVGELPYDSIF